MTTTIHNITTGDSVKGHFCGVPYAGVVRSHRTHAINHRIEVFCVDLDAPIVVFSLERESIEVVAYDNLETLAHFLGYYPEDDDESFALLSTIARTWHVGPKDEDAHAT